MACDIIAFPRAKRAPRRRKLSETSAKVVAFPERAPPPAPLDEAHRLDMETLADLPVTHEGRADIELIIHALAQERQARRARR